MICWWWGNEPTFLRRVSIATCVRLKSDDGRALFWGVEGFPIWSAMQRKPSSTPRSWVRTNGQKADARINSARCWWRYAPSMACSRTWQCVRFDRGNRTLLGRAAAPHLQKGAENSLLGANLALTRLRPNRVGLLCEMRSSLRDAGGKVRTRDVCADPLDACLQYFLRKC